MSHHNIALTMRERYGRDYYKRLGQKGAHARWGTPVVASDPMQAAADILEALDTEIIMIKAHIERVEAKRDRYRVGTLERGFANVEGIYWQNVLTVLSAIAKGKTVAPS